MNEIEGFNSNKFYWGFIALLFLIFVAAYHKTLLWMHGRYLSPDSYYSHGYLIPFVSIYIIMQKKKNLKNAIKIPSMWGGGLLIIFAALMHILGTILYVFSISGFSIFFLILGIVLFLYGYNTAKILLFPIGYLLFMFPVPLFIIIAISFPMKMLVAQFGVKIVSLLSIPLYREGFHIYIPAGQLLVSNPCSGLRSLIAFMALAAVIAHLSEISLLKKIILFFLSIPIAIISNVLRVASLILISNFWGLQVAAPDTIWHTLTGLLVFVIGFIFIYFANWMLKWKTSETDI